MDTPDFTKLHEQLQAEKTEITSKSFDVFAQHQIDVYGSKVDLLILVEDLNEEFELGLRESDIQETGMNDLLRFNVIEDF